MELIFLYVPLSSDSAEGSAQAGSMGQDQKHKVQQDQVLVLHFWPQQPHGALWAWGRMAGKPMGGEGPGGAGKQLLNMIQHIPRLV